MPFPSVSIMITTTEQSATHSAREGEKRVIEKITFHDEENDQQPTINSLDKNKELQCKKITFGPDPITFPTILQLKNNTRIFTDGGYVEGYRASIGVWLSDGHPNYVLIMSADCCHLLSKITTSPSYKLSLKQ
jgi:hypothetical protein